MVKRIGVLTSGGDAPGMNSAISSIVKVAHHKGIEVVGILEGYRGLFDENFKVLNLENTANISNLGGTILKSSRFEDFKKEEIVLKCIEHLKKQQIEGLIVIGGDGTYHGAMSLSKLGFPTVAIPGTIDNDISGTERTIGFESAVSTILESVEKLKDTARSHSRCLVVEVMGRHCGDLAQYSAIASDVDLVIISGNDIDLNTITQTVKDMIKLKDECMIIVSENVTDVYALAKMIEEATQIESRGIKLGYIQRGGSPSVGDRILSVRMGIKAVELLEEKNTSKAVCFIKGRIVHQSIEKTLSDDVKDIGIYEDFQKLR